MKSFKKSSEPTSDPCLFQKEPFPNPPRARSRQETSLPARRHKHTWNEESKTRREPKEEPVSVSPVELGPSKAVGTPREPLG